MTKPSIGRFLVGAFVVLSLAAITAGFLVIGSPAKQRLLALDRQRADDLRQIAGAVDIYWQNNESLPASLNELESAWVQQLEDPESGKAYTYQVTGAQAYRLCADFALQDDTPAEGPWDRDFANHGQGRHCFDLRAGGRWPRMSMPPLIIQ